MFVFYEKGFLCLRADPDFLVVKNLGAQVPPEPRGTLRLRRAFFKCKYYIFSPFLLLF